MCGRARCTLSVAQAARAFGFPTTSAAAGDGSRDDPAVPTLHIDRFRPSYNVSPGAYLPVGTVRARSAGGGPGGGGTAEDVGPVIQCMKWGLVPSFTGKTEKPDHFRMVPVGPNENTISKFFKKATAHDQPGKPDKTSQELAETNGAGVAKVEYDESVAHQSEEIKQQLPGDKHGTCCTTGKDEPVTLEPHVLEKPRSIKHEDVILADANVLSAKRKIEDTEVNQDTKMEIRGRFPTRPMKKEKGSKETSDGQASLLSYFAKK